MVRLPRRPGYSRIVLACALALPAGVFLAAPVLAQEEAAADAATQAQQAEVDPELMKAVEDYWHYGKIARYDLQNQAAERILAKSDNARAVRDAFRQVTRDRKDNQADWLLRWQGVKDAQENTTKIIQLINQGELAYRTNLEEIEHNLQRMNNGERPYQLGLQRLRNSGELAIPIIIDYLRDPAKAQFHGTVRRAMRDLGQAGLNPLVTATEMSGNENQDALVAVVTALGQIQDDDAVPYLAKLASGQNTPAAVRAAAQAALQGMGLSNPGNVNASDEFYNLAEKFYYDNASIRADTRVQNQPANVWFWDNAKGLQRKEVPAVIFNEIMAMRAAEYALKLGSSQDALSLWLASNYKREAELPEGAADPTRLENQPPAHYYGVASGPQYLNSALARALRDRNAPVAFRVIKSMQEVVGQQNVFEGNNAQALIESLGAPDRLVRFEGAFALAAARPQQSFPGQDRVVPLLAEALAQTGSSSVLLVLPSQDQLNTTLEALRGSGLTVAGATSADGAVGASAQLPAVDVIVASEELGAGQVDTLLATAGRNPRMSGAAKLIITQGPASAYSARAATDPLLSVTQATEPTALKDAIDQSRTKGQSLGLDQAGATDYALRAGELLKQLAIAGGQVFDMSAAENTLLAALKDPRPEVVMKAGEVLGLMSQSNAAQAGLLDAALAENAGDDVKVSLFKSLADNASNSTNKLSGEQTQRLEQVVSEAPNLDVRAAAAEARGALNLPAEVAKQLILNQSQGTGNGANRAGEQGTAGR
jgi:hypothetical protein